jgi:hypothetical protein
MKLQTLIEDARINRMISKIHGVLDTSMLQPQYRKQHEENPDLHCTTGHCYVAAEALWHALGGMDSPWRPVSGRDEEGTHWWLTNQETGEIADPTSDQYTSLGEEPPYHTGRRVGFLTKQPSKRAAQILRRAGLSVPTPNP